MDNELMSNLSSTFYVDGSGFFPAVKKKNKKKQNKTLQERSNYLSKHPTVIITGDKCQITVIACANAAGYIMLVTKINIKVQSVKGGNTGNNLWFDR